jgi:hypothetical protein
MVQIIFFSKRRFAMFSRSKKKVFQFWKKVSTLHPLVVSSFSIKGLSIPVVSTPGLHPLHLFRIIKKYDPCEHDPLLLDDLDPLLPKEL